MKKHKYDLKVMRVIKAVREVKNLKQLAMANALDMSEGNYNKIENGHHHVELWQLRILAKELKISLHQIVIIAEAEEEIDFGKAAPPDILNECIRLIDSHGTELKLANDELERVILKIKKSYYKR